MTTIRWLHLTDFHQGLAAQQWMWPTVREQFFEDVERLTDRVGPVDFILFSGDLAQSGKSEEYERLDENLKRLLKVLVDRGGPEPAVLAVPGNHDLERPNPRLAQVKLLRYWDTDADVRNDLFAEADGEPRQTIERAFSAYGAWWNQRTARLPSHVRLQKQAGKEALPGDFAATIEKDGLKLAVVGMNSAFLQLSADNYEGKLAVHPRQFHAACGGDASDFLRRHHAALLMTHHPRSWLSKNAQQDWQQEIYAGRAYVIAHVCGHMHVPLANSTRLGGGPADSTIQGASLFGLEKFLGPTGEEFERIHGYSLCSLEVTGREARLSIWPRILVRRQAGYLKMGADQSYDLDDSGALHYPVKLNASAPPMAAVSSMAKSPAPGGQPASAPASAEAATGPGSGASSTPGVSRASVRQMLERALRTDSDLEAFCLDYFPDVSRRFAGGMERTAKLNLLLSLKEPEAIVANLKDMYPKGIP